MAALMTELLDPQEGDSVLEVGTGLGYQTAILARLAAQVWSVEIVEEFAGIADARLIELGYRNVAIRIGDGSRGWAEAAPFDAILVSAAAKELPEALVGQLKPEGGRLVMPLGEAGAQRLVQVTREGSELTIREVMPVQFTELETV
jgi:protein-L-isoaspartate(D-aspartate) O-methyltransferase